MAVTSITQPGIHIVSDKINDAAEGKRHQTAGENRKQNGYKKETEQVQTENRIDINRKQNRYKQKTERMKTEDKKDTNRKLNGWKHGV